MNKRHIIILFFCTLCVVLISQTKPVYQVKGDEILKLKNDSIKIDKLLKLSYDCVDSNSLYSFQLANEALEIASRLGQNRQKITALNQLGDMHFYRANFQKSFLSYFKAYKLSDSINDRSKLAWSAYNLGWVAAIQQESYSDVKYLYQSLKLNNEIQDENLTLSIYNALGSFYTTKLNKDSSRSNFDSATKYFSKGIDFAKKIKRYARAGAFYVNIGQLFMKTKDFKSAQFYFNKSVDLFKNDSTNYMGALVKIASCDFEEKKYDLALTKYKSIYDFGLRHDRVTLRSEALSGIVQCYYAMGNYKLAYETQKENYALNSKILEESNAVTASNLETNYNYEKAEVSNRELKNLTEIQELKNKRKTIYISILIGVGLVIVIIAYLLLRQNKLKQHINSKLKEQNREISEKKHEIEQSIKYAKGIQTAFMPDETILNSLLNSNFIFYKPKDVVSGDFYWYKASKDKKQILIACADCTGHGVPGALMSMVGINMLQQLCGEEKLHQPHTVLKHLNNEIKDSLKQNTDQSKQRDGMDIALIRVDVEKNKLWYSGANRPLYIVRSSEVKEIKATKFAIGGYTDHDQEFEEHEITLSKGDLIVMSTDGYADQFGGNDGKKFMTKNFKLVLQKLTDHKPSDQLKMLQNAFIEWKGDHEQVDDICVMGFTV